MLLVWQNNLVAALLPKPNMFQGDADETTKKKVKNTRKVLHELVVKHYQIVMGEVPTKKEAEKILEATPKNLSVFKTEIAIQDIIEEELIMVMLI